ncbi:hypothetical protein QE152_g6493 [Popillia japonica]|uniref:Uncharacterized protein n=1 Tax=Popillia japonica TaxID=7064 RepID=A0AAW1MEI6_POPJA
MPSLQGTAAKFDMMLLMLDKLCDSSKIMHYHILQKMQRALIYRSPPSPDLNPLDFYFWRNLKSLVHNTEVNTEQEWQNRKYMLMPKQSANTLVQGPLVGDRKT